jgi:phosphonate utilization transcriptional regulator
MDMPIDATIALLQTRSLTQAVQQAIEQAILNGDYPPNTQLVEASLAEKLGVSRGPVREAFRMLDEAGLVRTEKNRGVFVRAMSAQEAAEVFDIRCALEELAGRQVASLITAQDVQALTQQVQDMAQLAQQGDAAGYHARNVQFHDQIMALAGNQRLLDMYRRLTKELAIFRRRNLGQSGALPLSVQGHQRIVSALTSGDPQAAALALGEHVRSSKQRALAAAQLTAAGHGDAT